MKQTQIHKLYNAYVDNPHLKGTQAAQMLGMSSSSIRVMKRRLIDKGFIEVDDNNSVRILQPFEGRFCEVSPLSWMTQKTNYRISKKLEPCSKCPYKRG